MFNSARDQFNGITSQGDHDANFINSANVKIASVYFFLN